MIINLINYFYSNLYCIVLLLCYAQYLILETVVLTFVYLYCIVSFVLFVCYVFFLTSFMSDCCMTEFVDLVRLCGLVVRVSGYRYRGLGFDSRRYQIF